MQSNENQEVVLLWNLNQPINFHNIFVIFRFITNVNEVKSLAGFYML